jgi:hypothetical protein
MQIIGCPRGQNSGGSHVRVPLSNYCLLDAHNYSISFQYGILALKMCNFILAYSLRGHRKKAHESPRISLRLLRSPSSPNPSLVILFVRKEVRVETTA